MLLNTIITGEGPPIILLHGLFGAAKNLGALARGLAPHGRVLAMDLPNHGASPHGPKMDFCSMAADVAETAAAEGIAAADIIGHSLGGKTAMALALAQPKLVSKLAVLDIAPVPYNHGYDDYIKAMQSIDLKPSLTRHAADAALAAVVADKPLRAFLLNNLILGDSPHWRLGLDEISAAMPDLLAWADPPGWQPYTGPTLFLRGGASDYVTDAATPEITARFPNAAQQTIPGAGHWLHAEQPAAVIAALTGFLFP
jgi:pimeloyl-ACP methyl ester carboxylesterase